MVLNVDMLGSGVVLDFLCKLYGTVVIAEDRRWPLEDETEVLEQTPDPDGLLARGIECHILCLSRRIGNAALSFVGPRYGTPC